MSNQNQNLLINITPEEAILFACTRQQFLDSHRERVLQLAGQTRVDWERIFSTAKLHGVAPLVYVNLRHCVNSGLDMPEEILKQFRLTVMQNTLAKEAIARQLVRALSFFSEQSIRVMLIKGAALDYLVYDQNYYTVINDVDLVLSLKPDETTPERFSEFMAYFDRSGVEYDYYEHHDMTMNGTLPVDFDRIWREALPLKIGQHQAWVMSPEDVLISLCINSCRKRYFRLKALCDIAETISRFDNLDWSKLVEKATSYDCRAIVYAALLITQLTLGCALPTDVLDRLKIGPVRTRLIHYLSRRLSLSAYESLHDDKTILGRNLDASLILSYFTFRTYQIWRRIKFAALFTETGARRFGARQWAVTNS